MSKRGRFLLGGAALLLLCLSAIKTEVQYGGCRDLTISTPRSGGPKSTDLDCGAYRYFPVMPVYQWSKSLGSYSYTYVVCI